jgi:hypothetical protein
MSYDLERIADPRLREVMQLIMDITTGHDHDGANSKAVTTGTPAAGALTADAGGRAIIAGDYFDAATVLAKFAIDSIDNAQLLKAVKDGAFVADTATRALFANGLFTAAKLAATAKTHIMNILVEDLAAGVDITARVAMVVPTGYAMTIVQADMIPLGSGAGIDDSNNCLVGIGNGANSIAFAAYDSAPGYPAVNTVNSLGALDGTYKNLAAGEKLTITITNGATANPPAMIIQVAYTLSEA